MERDNEQAQPAQTPPDGQNRGLIRNSISLIGGAMAAVSLANVVFLFLIDAIAGRPSPYIGIFAYMIMPAFLILGLVLVPAGMLLERHRRRKRVAQALPAYPQIDLNSPQQRNAVAFFLSFVVVFVLLSAVGSYRAYEFTESVQFCGQLCHSVMNPEFIATASRRTRACAALTAMSAPAPTGTCVPSCRARARYTPPCSTSILVLFPRRLKVCVPRRRPVKSATGRASSTAISSKSLPTMPATRRTPPGRFAC
jgi:MFS family permease